MKTRNEKSRKKYFDSSSEDESAEDKDADFRQGSDSDSDFEYVQSTSKNKKGIPKKSVKQRSSERTRHSKFSSNKNRNLVDEPPQNLSELTETELHTDPDGTTRRFIPFEEIKDKVLYTSKYLQPNESGIMTFLPNFKAGDPHHLEYFGFTSKLQKTELTKIYSMSDEQLKEELRKTTEELNSIPPTENPTSIAVPGFSTNLKNSIAISADIRTFDWKKLGSIQKFDVIVMDPPWQITFSTVTRGVQLSYQQLEHTIIAQMPLQYVQNNGFMFMWVVASQLMNGIAMMKNWGYKIINTINWIKVSKSGIYLPSHGYYFQHNKETVLVGLKGDPPEEMNCEAFKSLIVGPREVRQSQKPAALYEMIEEMFPGMMYLEVFARPHNLREGWVSIGIELPT